MNIALFEFKINQRKSKDSNEKEPADGAKHNNDTDSDASSWEGSTTFTTWF